MGFEHSLVSMFLFPSDLLLGGGFSVKDYLVWNTIHTVLGNLVGGPTFGGSPCTAPTPAQAPPAPGRPRGRIASR